MTKENLEILIRHAKGIVAVMEMEQGTGILKHEDCGLAVDGMYTDKFELSNGETVTCETPYTTDPLRRMNSVVQQLSTHGVTKHNIDFYCWQKDRERELQTK